MQPGVLEIHVLGLSLMGGFYFIDSLKSISHRVGIRMMRRHMDSRTTCKCIKEWAFELSPLKEGLKRLNQGFSGRIGLLNWAL